MAAWTGFTRFTGLKFQRETGWVRDSPVVFFSAGKWISVPASGAESTFSLRKTNFYQEVALRYCSLLIAVLAGAWFFERALDRRILPF